MEIIKEREYVERIEYSLYYELKTTRGAGFLFSCDKEGNLLNLDKPESQANYEKCVSGEHNVIFKGIQRHDTSYWEDAVGICVCGEEVQLGRFTNECDHCERLFNSAGQLLVDRSLWGEETGESHSDIEGPSDRYDY